MKEELIYIVTFLMAMTLTVIVHYYAFSKINMHATLHVVISLIILWLFLSVVVLIVEKIKKQKLQPTSSQ